MRRPLAATLAGALAACASSPPAPASPASPPEPPAGVPTQADAGKPVTLVGEAQDAKLGALLVTPAGTVWIDALDAWPAGLRGKRVRVTGTVAVRADLPVFEELPKGAMQQQGMPVPRGTDLEQARRRVVIAGARWVLE